MTRIRAVQSGPGIRQENGLYPNGVEWRTPIIPKPPSTRLECRRRRPSRDTKDPSVSLREPWPYRSARMVFLAPYGLRRVGRRGARDALGLPILRSTGSSRTTVSSVVLGVASVALFTLVGRNSIAAREPTAEVDIGAPAGTKRPKSLDRPPAADRTWFRRTTLDWITHAANIGTVRLRGKGPIAAPGEPRIRPVRLGRFTMRPQVACACDGGTSRRGRAASFYPFV
jgi:hypothetical protein